MPDPARTSHQTAAATFDLARARARLDGTPDAINAAIECCDRHPPAVFALRYEARDGASRTLTFADLAEQSARVAHVLVAQGVCPGDRVSVLLPRIPELLATMLGIWRAGAVYQPLFTAFGPAAITHRLRTAGACLVVTDAINRAKLEPGHPPVLCLGATGDDLDYATLTAAAPTSFNPVMRSIDDPFLLLSTSGTTGPAKAVPVPLGAIAAFIGYMEQAVDLRPTDRFWNIADPGWAYGLYYAAIGPLALGHATTFYDGPFTVESTVGLVARLGITNLCGSPTAFRMLIAAGPEAVRPIRGQLRVVSSAGEPLNPEVIRWFRDHLDAPIHDHYGQTELGMVVCNHHALEHPVHLGAAGVPVPGHTVAVLDPKGQPLPPGQPGILAIDRAASPLFWFTGYEGAPPLSDRYYLTGDTVEALADGAIAFIGRSDDIITSSGYRIGPFDVESALIEHPAVVEAAVIGKPDPERTEIVKAFVVLQPGTGPTPALAEALQQHVRTRLSAHAYPREIAFVDALPKTPSGKLQRFLLRNAERAETPEARARSVPNATGPIE